MQRKGHGAISTDNAYTVPCALGNGGRQSALHARARRSSALACVVELACSLQLSEWKKMEFMLQWAPTSLPSGRKFAESPIRLVRKLAAGKMSSTGVEKVTLRV